MSSYLITFKPSSENPKRGWPVEELKRLVKGLDAGERVVEKWRFRSIKAAKKGERVFLLQQGKRGPVIIGYGSVAGAASKSSGQWRVPVAFDELVDPAGKALVSKEVLRAIPGTTRTWRTQSSGIRLRDSVAEALERLAVSARGEVEPDNQEDEAAEKNIAVARNGQGRVLDPKVRHAIEWRAMDLARLHYEREGYTVRDTSSHRPYDYVVSKARGHRRVEVKGTQGDGEFVVVTAGEVNAARAGPEPTDLFLVSGIEITRRKGEVFARGGTVRILSGWQPDDDELAPTEFRYRLPER